MDRSSRSGPSADLIRSARVVAVGQQNASDAMAAKLIEIFLGRLHRIDAEIPAGVEDEMAVEVVAVRFGKPRPGEYAA